MPSRHKGVILMLSAAFFFGAGNLFVKIASEGISSWETVFYRGTGGLIFAWIVARIRYGGFQIKDRKRLLLRGVIGALSVSCYFFGIKHGNMTTATMLTYTFPVFGSIFSLIIYREKPPRFFWPLLAVAIAGIFIILNPGHRGLKTADLIPLLGGVLAGGAISLVRKLRHTDKPETVFASFMVFAILLTTPFAAPRLSLYPAGTWLALLAMIICTSIAQIQMSKAYHTLKVSTGGVIQLTSVLFTALFALFYGDRLTLRMILGGILIIGASAAVMLPQNGQRKLRR